MPRHNTPSSVCAPVPRHNTHTCARAQHSHLCHGTTLTPVPRHNIHTCATAQHSHLCHGTTPVLFAFVCILRSFHCLDMLIYRKTLSALYEMTCHSMTCHSMTCHSMTCHSMMCHSMTCRFVLTVGHLASCCASMKFVSGGEAKEIHGGVLYI